ncbi:MAG: hypothetical protein WAW37_17350 [Syntrophobacteraceae bacterium]
MNLYDEFFLMVSLFNELEIRYAVVGGIALAFHARPRFTRDIDVLVHQDDMGLLKTAMDRLSYEETAESWELMNTTLTLHRFLKIEGQDELMIDILVANSDEHFSIIRGAELAESAKGVVPVAAKRDIIWLKRSRSSDQDLVDISELEGNDEDRESS